MTAKTEMKNFIDHYGLRDTLDALDEYIQEGERKEWEKEAIKEFVEQQAFYFDFEI